MQRVKKDNRSLSERMSSMRTWADDERDKNAPMVRRRIVYLAVAALALIVLLVLVTVLPSVSGMIGSTNEVSASDTYAVSTADKEVMQTRAKAFVTGYLASQYLSDGEVAAESRELAMACVADSTELYESLSTLPVGNGSIAADRLKVVTDEPSITSGTKSYTGSFVYSVHAQVADVDGDDGSFVDNGYDFKLKFDIVSNEEGTASAWLITDMSMSNSR